MRRILVDHARRHRAAKRGGGGVVLVLDESVLPAMEPQMDLVALDDALKDLEVIDVRKYQVVMLWFFMGLTQEEIGRELGISVNTVARQWQSARRWLQHELQGGAGVEAE
jgi:RNA polymerase sigma factor (TIGR02999 family)